MGCNCKNEITNFLGGDVPNPTTFLDCAEADGTYNNPLETGKTQCVAVQNVLRVLDAYFVSGTVKNSGQIVFERTVTGCSICNVNISNTDLLLDGNHVTDVASYQLMFDSGSVEVLKLRTAGVTIGPSGADYTMPMNRGTNGYILQTNGGGGVSWVATGQSGQYWSANTNNAGYHNTISNSGFTNVGIGTHVPNYELTVSGDIGVNEYIYHNGNPLTFIKFDDDSINLVAGNKSALKYLASTGKIQINNSNGNIDLNVMGDDGSIILQTDATNNRVGINTVPTEALHVDGNVTVNDDIHVSGNTKIIGTLSANTVSGDTVVVGPAATSYTLPTIRGTNAYILQTNGAGATTWVATSDTTGHYWSANTNNAGYHNTISNSGFTNVGIGTHVPDYKLTVSGSVYASANLHIQGVSNLDNTDIDGTFTSDGTTFDVNATARVDIDNTNTTNGVTINTATSGGKVFIGHATSETTVNDNLSVTGDLAVDGTSNLDNTDIDGTFTMDGTAFDVNGTTTVAIDNTNTTNGVTINTVTSGSKVFIGHTVSETTVNDNLSVTGDLAVDGTSNLDNTDVDGTFVVDGSNISLDSTSTLNIDNSNTSNGITIGTATSAVPISIGHTTSLTTIKDNLNISGNTNIIGTLSANTVSGDTVIVGPAATSYTLPTIRGTNAYVLQTNGAGATSWVSTANTNASYFVERFQYYDTARTDGLYYYPKPMTDSGRMAKGDVSYGSATISDDTKIARATVLKSAYFVVPSNCTLEKIVGWGEFASSQTIRIDICKFTLTNDETGTLAPTSIGNVSYVGGSDVQKTKSFSSTGIGYELSAGDVIMPFAKATDLSSGSHELSAFFTLEFKYIF